MEINVNNDYVELFIDKIEDLMEQSDEEEYIQDEAGTYLKSSYLRDLILETRRLTKYGEYKIALENMLENLSEVSIPLDKVTIELAYRAFDRQISSYIEHLLSKLIKL